MNRLADDKCPRCFECPDEEGHDSCLGTLVGLMNACCGHGGHMYGGSCTAYVQFWDGECVRGDDAIVIIEILKKVLVKTPKSSECPTCKGEGYTFQLDVKTPECQDCNGSGK